MYVSGKLCISRIFENCVLTCNYKQEKVQNVRSILFCLKAPLDEENQFLEQNSKTAQSRKEKRRHTDYKAYSISVYSIMGRRLCRNQFSAIVQLNATVNKRHATEISQCTSIKLKSLTHVIIKGNQKPQTITVISFLNRYGELHGLVNPSGRQSTE